MVKVKARATREANYRRSIGGVAANYKSGIEQTQGWQTAAIAGQALYEQKLQDPEVLSRRAKALQRTSETDWKNAALTKGTQRITSGMEAGASKQAANYEPYAQALESVTLPPKSADAMANIDARVKPIVQAMVNTKKSIG